MGGGYDLPSLCTHYKLGADLDLIPCGNPVIYDFTGEQSDKWLIILDVPAFRETNQKIIYIVTEVARTLNKKILIRLHPHERGIKAPYKIDDSICEYSTENIYPAVVFGHTSTMLYTYLARNVLTLKIKSDVKSNSYDEKLMFGSAEDIIKILNDLPNINLRACSEPFIKYIGDESKQKYKEFFANLDLEV